MSQEAKKDKLPQKESSDRGKSLSSLSSFSASASVSKSSIQNEYFNLAQEIKMLDWELSQCIKRPVSSSKNHPALKFKSGAQLDWFDTAPDQSLATTMGPKQEKISVYSSYFDPFLSTYQSISKDEKTAQSTQQSRLLPEPRKYQFRGLRPIPSSLRQELRQKLRLHGSPKTQEDQGNRTREVQPDINLPNLPGTDVFRTPPYQIPHSSHLYQSKETPVYEMSQTPEIDWIIESPDYCIPTSPDSNSPSSKYQVPKSQSTLYSIISVDQLLQTPEIHSPEIGNYSVLRTPEIHLQKTPDIYLPQTQESQVIQSTEVQFPPIQLKQSTATDMLDKIFFEPEHQITPPISPTFSLDRNPSPDYNRSPRPAGGLLVDLPTQSPSSSLKTSNKQRISSRKTKTSQRKTKTSPRKTKKSQRKTKTSPRKTKKSSKQDTKTKTKQMLNTMAQESFSKQSKKFQAQPEASSSPLPDSSSGSEDKSPKFSLDHNPSPNINCLPRPAAGLLMETPALSYSSLMSEHSFLGKSQQGIHGQLFSPASLDQQANKKKHLFHKTLQQK